MGSSKTMKNIDRFGIWATYLGCLMMFWRVSSLSSFTYEKIDCTIGWKSRPEILVSRFYTWWHDLDWYGRSQGLYAPQKAERLQQSEAGRQTPQQDICRATNVAPNCWVSHGFKLFGYSFSSWILDFNPQQMVGKKSKNTEGVIHPQNHHVYGCYKPSLNGRFIIGFPRELIYP